MGGEDQGKSWGRQNLLGQVKNRLADKTKYNLKDPRPHFHYRIQAIILLSSKSFPSFMLGVEQDQRDLRSHNTAYIWEGPKIS